MKKSVKITLIVVSILLALALIFLFTLPYAAFHIIFGKPSRTSEVPDYYIGTPHYEVSQAGLAVMKTLPSEDLYIESRDGLKLHAYLFPAETESKKFVIGIHGYRSYSRPEFAPYIEFYRSLGYNMVLPDDRAHEPSEGKYIGFGVLDRLDCVDWAKYIVETYGEDVEILLHGVSMGGATVLSASGESDLPVQVKGIISDCGFTNPYDIISYQMKEIAHIPPALCIDSVEKICIRKAGFNFHDYSAVEQVKKAKVPILFVHGEEDKVVPFSMVQELYDACASEKRLLTVPGAGHGESIAFAPDEYHRMILELFDITP